MVVIGPGASISTTSNREALHERPMFQCNSGRKYCIDHERVLRWRRSTSTRPDAQPGGRRGVAGSVGDRCLVGHLEGDYDDPAVGARWGLNGGPTAQQEFMRAIREFGRINTDLAAEVSALP